MTQVTILPPTVRKLEATSAREAHMLALFEASQKQNASLMLALHDARNEVWTARQVGMVRKLFLAIANGGAFLGLVLTGNYNAAFVIAIGTAIAHWVGHAVTVHSA